ncbi:MAG TPA: carboxypeptidase regulatory-like domain-containing protein [Vicinamibacterales bacterium]|nr:carboxypeptidase regulatory-like domain-containing protein [Vicinamibacterales bacterium]
MRLFTIRLMVFASLSLGLAVPSAAQEYTGRIDVTVTDASGAILPGVTVELSGPQTATATTDTTGEAHFLRLAPGVYTISASLAGFNQYTNRNIPVVGGGAVPLKVSLAVGDITQTVEVTAESPIIDPRRTATTTNVTNDELQQIPSARDPWVVLQSVPGVVVDRVNVGGAESGQQSNYQAKGAASGENTWNIDGIAITDMSALGSSPTYYDFDMFQEMNVTTGGADLQNPTPGVALNFVLKSGTNSYRGSSRIYFEDESMQANNLPDDLRASLGGVGGKGNRIKNYKDYGFELGGPLWKDRVWAWGAYGKTDVTLLTLQNTPDQTILDNRSFKATAQATPAVRGNFTFFRGDKLKYGRGAGATRPPETTWDQSGPTALYKGEGNLVAGSNFFVTGRFAYVDGGFALTPQGGLSTPYFVDDGGSIRGSYIHYETVRPQKNASLDGNVFAGRNEIKFGFGWRKADVDSTTIVPGPGRIVTYHDGYPNMTAEVTVWNDNLSASGEYLNAYIGDTVTWDRLTLNAGLRWDSQRSSVNALSQPGNPTLQTLLPDLQSTARDDVITWNSVTPRIGISYALDAENRTLARASYGAFASQLNAGTGNFLSTVGYRGVYFYNVPDLNGNRIVDPAEIAGRQCTDTIANAGGCSYYGFDVDNPANIAEPIHKVGDYKTPTTHEFQLGLDHELMPNFGLSGTFTMRQFTNFTWRNNGLRGSDYQQIDTLTGNHPAVGTYSVPIYGVIPGRIPANRAATTYSEREGYSQRYVGFELAATKRLSNRWMGRFAFSTNVHREYFDSIDAVGAPLTLNDPTPFVSATNAAASTNQDGGIVIRTSSGSGKSAIYQVLPKYQFIITGLYQAPYGINLAMNMNTRQGFGTPYHRTQVPTADPLAARKSVLVVTDLEENRLPTVVLLDLRVGKEFAFQRARFNVDFDIFNALNRSTVLGRQFDLRVSTANNVQEIMNPRVLRLGVRFNF